MTEYGDEAARADEQLEQIKTTARSTQAELRSGDVLAALAFLRWIETDIAVSQRSLVRCARLTGYSWSSIGDSLGMSRQAAQQRFGDL